MRIWTALFLFLSLTSSAQQIRWSEKVSTKGVFQYLGRSGTDYFTAQEPGNGQVFIRRFNQELKLLKEDTLTFDKSQTYLLSFVNDKELVHVIVANESKKLTKVFLQRQSLSIPSTLPPTLTPAGDLKDGYKNLVYAYLSPDHSHLLVTNFSIKVSTQTITRDFVLINTRTGQVQSTGTSVIEGGNESIGVTNTGLIWTSAIQNQSKYNKLLAKVKSQYKVIFTKPDNTTTEYLLRWDNKYTPGIDIIDGDGTTAYLTGFAYENDAKLNTEKGNELYVYTLNTATGQVTDSAFTMLNGLYPPTRLKEEDRLPYTIRQIHKKSDGSYSLLAEQYQLISGQYGVTLKYNDIASVQLQKDFTVTTLTRMPKMQFGSDNPSYLAVFTGDTIDLFYNDLKENINAPEDKLAYPSNKSIKNALFHIRLDAANKPTKQLLYDYANGEPMPVIKGSLVEKGEVVVVAEGMMGVMRI